MALEKLNLSNASPLVVRAAAWIQDGRLPVRPMIYSEWAVKCAR
ncbi:MAG: hypothetical protein ACE3JK_15040 [Sporolactobacillus sp.]